MSTGTILRKKPLDQARVAYLELKLVWYVVAAVVLFALGATILIGAIAWCSAHGMSFGAVHKAGTFTYSVGCIR